MTVELKFRIKTKTGKVVELDENEARTVLLELKRILEPSETTTPIPTPWTQPVTSPAKPWDTWWVYGSDDSTDVYCPMIRKYA